VQERRAVESVAARKALESQREQTRAEYVGGIMTDLAEAEPKAAASGWIIQRCSYPMDTTL
jgi:hypothetical protein